MEHNRVIYERPYDSEVEYLESSENQFIDTGIIISSNIGILADIQMTNSVGWFFGGGEGYLINEFGIMTDANYSIFRFGNKEVRLTPLRNTEKITFDNLENPNVLKVGNLIYTTTYNTFTSAATIYLFTNKRINTAVRGTVGLRIFYFKIYYSGILVRDFIPVRKGNIGYMYDKVSGKLFENKGTGNFILGQDVANPVPNIRRVFRFGNKRFVMPMPYDSKIEYLESS